ncbi:MAG: SpoIID/LytB domain-containing protein [Oscillospiraceae bacterium]|jgi:stage II sporulation protein D|nr:SpoIID/LytB domain-containing protein [Oscillospiraceae bacterium]
MKNTAAKRVRMFAAAVALLLSSALPSGGAGAYVPPVNILRIGMYYGGSALPSANLQNVSGSGSGFEFGWFDKDTREFVSIGAVTYETKITMMRDANMYYKEESSGGGAYVQEKTGDTVVGCFHVQLPGSHGDFNSADAIARQYNGGFVKYDKGVFYVCAGDYTTRAGAEEAMAAIGAGGSVTAGTEYTIAVAVTGTGRVIFEFDYGTEHALGVRPLSSGGKPMTWFKGLYYYGAFQYFRASGENLRVINFVNVEDYLKGLLPAEMPNTWPIEALKAQAVTARTYAAGRLGFHGASGFDMCATDHCQVYVGSKNANETTDRAVDETAGQYITYGGEVCETYYASCDGGATEDVENVWAQPLPHLRGVIDPYEADVASQVSGYYWTVQYSPAELTARMRGRGYNCGTIVSLSVSQYTKNGNAYSVTMKDENGRTWTFKKDDVRITLGAKSIRLTIGGGTQPGAVAAFSGRVYANSGSASGEIGLSGLYAVGGSGSAEALPESGLYAVTGGGETVEVGSSSVGAVQTESSPDGKIDGKFVISGTGKGHNVGMSQWGAYAMAQRGMTYLDIIRFYYTGVEVG